MNKFVFKGLYGLGSRHGYVIEDGFAWPQPENGEPGRWVSLPAREDRKLNPHFWGFHGAKFSTTASWLYSRNFVMEAGGEIRETGEVIVCSRARLVRELILPPGAGARLCLAYLADIIDFPANARFPMDQLRAISDTYKHLQLRLGEWDKIQEIPRSPLEYCFQHMKKLLDRCEQDRRTTVEWSDNMEALWHLAKALCRTARFVTDPEAPAWEIIKDVSYHCREAVRHAVMQITIMLSLFHYKKPCRIYIGLSKRVTHGILRKLSRQFMKCKVKGSIASGVFLPREILHRLSDQHRLLAQRQCW